jgi:transcription-repair coupling factor (superfamily II helicase)
VAEKRLKVLGDLDSLGAGFQLASHDLDIRGAGNLLGDEQSGHIREVGFELYQSMLEDAILAAKAGELGLARERHALSPQITVDAPIMIPEDYVPDLAVRMALYRRLNDAEDAAEVESAVRRNDRPLRPPAAATANLVKLIQIKRQAIEAHIAKIDVGAKGTLVIIPQDSFPDPAGLIAYAARLEGTIKLRPDSKIAVIRGHAARLGPSKGLAQIARLNGEAGVRGGPARDQPPTVVPLPQGGGLAPRQFPKLRPANRLRLQKALVYRSYPFKDFVNHPNRFSIPLVTGSSVISTVIRFSFTPGP